MPRWGLALWRTHCTKQQYSLSRLILVLWMMVFFPWPRCSSILATIASSQTTKLLELGSADNKTYQAKMLRLANAIVLALKHYKCSIDRLIVRDLPKLCLIAYTDVISYDETPMKTTVKDSGSAGNPGCDSLQTLSSPTSSLLTSLRRLSKNQGVVGKLLQTKPKYGFLLQVGGRYVQIWGGCYTPIQCLERNSSPVTPCYG